MIRGSDLNETIDYVLKNDSDNPTIWKLGVISKYLFAKIAEENAQNKIEMVYRILQIGIKGWENSNIPYQASKEKIYGTEMDVPSIETLGRFPLEAMTELSIKLIEINQLSGEERKN